MYLSGGIDSSHKTWPVENTGIVQRIWSGDKRGYWLPDVK